MKLLFYLGHLDVVWFRVVLIRATNQQSEKSVKLLATVTVDRSTNRPHHGEDKQALQPASYLFNNKKALN